MNIKNEIDNGIGYYIAKIDKAESNYIKNKIQEQFNEILKLNNIQTCNFENYHKLNLNDDLHKKIWTRENRNGADRLSKFLLESSFLKSLEKEFFNLEFSNVVDKKNPDIYWRIVRPNKEADVGTIHADVWFWQTNNWVIPSGKKCLKIWMILSERIDEGLSMIDYSQKKNDWVYKKIYKDGLNKPEFDLDKNNFKLTKLKAPFDKAIIFNYKTLHCGAINKSDVTRVSLEFTLFYNN